MLLRRVRLLVHCAVHRGVCCAPVVACATRVCHGVDPKHWGCIVAAAAAAAKPRMLLLYWIIAAVLILHVVPRYAHTPHARTALSSYILHFRLLAWIVNTVLSYVLGDSVRIEAIGYRQFWNSQLKFKIRLPNNVVRAFHLPHLLYMMQISLPLQTASLMGIVGLVSVGISWRKLFCLKIEGVHLHFDVDRVPELGKQFIYPLTSLVRFRSNICIPLQLQSPICPQFFSRTLLR